MNRVLLRPSEISEMRKRLLRRTRRVSGQCPRRRDVLHSRPMLIGMDGTDEALHQDRDDHQREGERTDYRLRLQRSVIEIRHESTSLQGSDSWPW